MVKTSIYVIALLVLVSCAEAAGENAAWLGLNVGDGVSTWGVQKHGCGDGTSATMLSSLVGGEAGVGSLRSEPFVIPGRLSFWLAGASHQKKNWIRLIHAETGQVLRTQEPPGTHVASYYEWDLKDVIGSHRQTKVYIELTDGDTGSSYAWIALARLEPSVLTMPSEAATNIPSGWKRINSPPQHVQSAGIGFLASSSLGVSTEGGIQQHDRLNIRAGSLYVLGCTNSIEEANPAWGGGDSFKNIFIGDTAGELVLKYASGREDAIPLVFGFNIWWRGAYRSHPDPLVSSAEAAEVLDAALCVVHGKEAGNGEEPYFFKVVLRDETLASITFRDSKDKIGWFNVQALSFGDVRNSLQADKTLFAPLAQDVAATPAIETWLATHTVNSADPFPESRRKAVKALARLLYTYNDDVRFETVRSTPPPTTNTSWTCPKVQFEGTPEAQILSNVYADSTRELWLRVDDNGLVHESKEQAENYGAFGTSRKLGAFRGQAYTRNRTLTTLTSLGFSDEVERACDFFDRWLMYFPMAWPKVQLGGKPVPGHTPVIANRPHLYFDELRHVGWGTKYTVRDFGNPENDGHGLLMLTRWRAWVKAGRPVAWVNRRWKAIHEAAEYIPWALDNPKLSFSEHGLLYNESEGGMQMASLYCDMPCYLGLLAYAEMADAAGHADKGKRWRQQADRLFKAMEAYYPKRVEPWGDVWDPAKSANWEYHQGVLAPIVIGMDYWGPDAKEKLPADWASRTERSYRMTLERLQPAWCAPAGLGYGQCYVAQSALLLDQMEDARQLVNWLARFCYAPRQPHPYRVPEGVTMSSDGSVWRRWGDLGNLYQMNEVAYTILLLLGIDELDAGRVTLMPRLLPGWTSLSVADYPLQSGDGTNVSLTPFAMTYMRPEPGRYRCTLRTSKPVELWRVRVGPFPKSAQELSVIVNDAPGEGSLFDSGDSRWAWVNLRKIADSEIVVEVSAR